MQEADLRADDIVGAHQAGLHGEPNAPIGKEVTFLLMKDLCLRKFLA